MASNSKLGNDVSFGARHDGSLVACPARGGRGGVACFKFHPAIQPVMETLWPHVSLFDPVQPLKVACKYKALPHVLGSGSFSLVYEAVNTESRVHYALKQIPKLGNRNKVRLIQNEIRILALLRDDPAGRYLIRLHDYFHTQTNLYVVTDLEAGGDLFDRIANHGRYKSEKEAIRVVVCLLKGLKFLVAQGIIHRDVKAENIFFHRGYDSRVVLGDFGLAVFAEAGNNTVCGTLSYMAPEIVSRKTYSYPVDVWALGVVVYFMLCGYMPFDCETEEETKHTVTTGDFMFEPREYWNHVSQHTRAFIEKCFILDPSDRPSAEQLLEYISDAPKPEHGDDAERSQALDSLRESLFSSLNSASISEYQRTTSNLALKNLAEIVPGEQYLEPEFTNEIDIKSKPQSKVGSRFVSINPSRIASRSQSKAGSKVVSKQNSFILH